MQKTLFAYHTTLQFPSRYHEGRNEVSLQRWGCMVGKISINTAWSAREVQKEMSSVFANAFGITDGDLLSYQ